MPIVLASAAAAVFGVSDFLGGTAARRLPSAVVAMLAQLAGLLALGLITMALPAAALPTALGWGLLAGLAGGVGVPVLYRGLAEGPMNVVAPLTALTSAAVPVAAGAVFGERPSASAWVGIALAVVAGVVVGASVQPDDGPAASGSKTAVRGVALALFAGLCFGGFFVLLARADPVSGLWPVTAARLAGCLVAAGVLLAKARVGGLVPADARDGSSGSAAASRLNQIRSGWRLAVFGGVLDALANALYLGAAQHGQLAVVGAVVALYPASTVLLARLLHGERIGPVQRIGLVLAVPALVLVSAG